MAGLTEKQKAFCFEYSLDFDAKRALVAAGFSDAGNSCYASILLSQDNVQEEIERYKARAFRLRCLSPDFVLNEWALIVLADPTKMMSLKVVPCPKCWPENMQDLLSDPNPQCLTCSGAGQRTALFTDSKTWGPAERALFAGIKQDAKGAIEIKTHSKLDALKSLANFYGMDTQKVAAMVQLSSPAGATVNDLTEDQLRAIAASGLGVSSGVPQLKAPVTLEGS